METIMPAAAAAPVPRPDPLSELCVQPALPTVVDARYELLVTCPEVDEDFVDKVVGSQARYKRRLVINHHRELSNRCAAGAIHQLNREQTFARLHLPVKQAQARHYRLRFYLTPTWAYFEQWPTWAMLMFLQLLAVGWFMTLASAFGIFRLLSNTARLADAPVACVLIAGIVCGCIYGIKGGLASIESPDWRRRFRKGLAVLTALLAVTYFVLLSLLTGGLGATVMNALQLVQTSPKDSFAWLSPHVQYVQLCLEATAALASFFFADFLCEQHGLPTRLRNPKKQLRAQQWNAAKEAYQQTYQVIGRARGARRQLLADRKSYVLAAIALFERKAELAKRQEEGLRRQRGEAAPEPPRGWFQRIWDFIED